MSRPRLGIGLAIGALCTCSSAVAVNVLFATNTLSYRVFSMAGLVFGAIVSVGVLVGFARPGALEDAQDRRRLENEALTDSLTGLRNARAFNEDLAREVALAERSSLGLGLVLLDVDGLKTINDAKGHQAGDELIKTVSKAITATLRAGDVGYRIGGDEFAVLMPGARTWGAFRFAQRLQAALAGSSSPLRPRASAGVTGWDGQTRDELIHEADLALISAKRSRRGALIYTDDLAVRDQGYQSDTRVDRVELVATALAQSVDQLESVSPTHTTVVVEIAAMIATELGLGADHVRKIRRAATLHDVGIMGVPTELLAKTERFTDGDREAIERHTVLGERIVRGLGLIEEAGWIRHHHERIDGTGYPDALAGPDIPLEASILFVADAFEALTTNRPNRPAQALSQAIAELQRSAGTQFRCDVVDALVAAIGSDGSGAERLAANCDETANTPAVR
jgi:diguanylate cyclase (GGDEF)-like protein